MALQRFYPWLFWQKGFNLELEYRRVVEPARTAAIKGRESGKGNEGIFCGPAIDLGNGTIVTGNNSPQFHAASSLILHAIKHLAEIPDKIKLLPPTSSIRFEISKPRCSMKKPSASTWWKPTSPSVSARPSILPPPVSHGKIGGTPWV